MIMLNRDSMQNDNAKYETVNKMTMLKSEEHTK